MNRIQLKNEIERLIQASPYSKEEIMAIFQKEDEDWNVDEIMAYSVALDYMREKKGDTKKLERLFERRKNKLIKFYK